MPMPTDYTAPAMTDDVTPLHKANMQTWLQGLGDHADNRLKMIEESPINIEYFGARPATTNNTATIQEACDHYGGGADLLVPPTGTFKTGPVKPGTETTFKLSGRLAPLAGAEDSQSCLLDFSVPGGKGRGGGVIGDGVGRLMGNRICHNLVYLNSWHGANFRDFAVCDQVYSGVYCQSGGTPPTGGAAGSGDCDGHLFHHVMHYHQNAAGGGVDTTDRPMRFLVFDGGGGAGNGCSDNSVEGNCYVSDGLAEASNPGGGTTDGGYGIEIINASRIRIKNFGCFDNTRFYSGAVLMQVTSAMAGSLGQVTNVVEDLYAESQASSPPAGWNNAAVEIRAALGSTLPTQDHRVSGLRMASTAGNLARRLWCRNLVNLQPVGRVTFVSYKEPRGHIASSGQITLAAGVSNCLIELMSTAAQNEAQFISPATPVNGNKYVNLLA